MRPALLVKLALRQTLALQVQRVREARLALKASLEPLELQASADRPDFKARLARAVLVARLASKAWLARRAQLALKAMSALEIQGRLA